MSVGKYSPTVTFSYMRDQTWWDNHKDDPLSWYDKDGYDSYGYGKDDKDRAGYTEMDYLTDGRYDEELDRMVYNRHDMVFFEWSSKRIN